MPKEIQWVVRNQFYFHWEERFIEYLKSYGSVHPLVLSLDKRDVPIEWDADETFSSNIHIDATKKRIRLKKVLFLGKSICRKPYLPGKRLAIDLKSKKMGLLEKRNAWGLWDIWSRQAYSRNSPYDSNTLYSKDSRISSLKMPLKEYRRDPFIVPDDQVEELDDLILTVNGRTASPERARQSYSVSIEIDRDVKDSVSLKVWCGLEGIISHTTRSFFHCLHFIGSGWNMAAPLRAKKRRKAMIGAFIRLLSAKTRQEEKKIIINALSNGDFRKRKIKSEARDLLMNAFAHLQDRSSRLTFTDGKWVIARNEKDEEKTAYIILYDLFGPEIFIGMRAHNEVFIQSSSFYKNLSTLSQLFKENNIRLSFNDMPVESTTIDASIDLDRSGEIDWFELRPEIRCGGEVIGEKEWLKIVTNGVLERNGSIQILDPKSKDILKTIVSIYRPAISEKDKKRAITRIPRLRILDWIYLRNQGVKVRFPEEDEKIIGRLAGFKRIEDKPVPPSLQSILRHYQKDACRWLSFLYEHRFGAYLADDMGLGKTIQAISLLAGIKYGKVQPPTGVSSFHLVVVPPSLLFNWENEINRFYPDLRICMYTGPDRRLDLKDCDILLTTYGIVRRDIERLKETEFNVIIFDEAQTIKNIYAGTTSAARRLNGHFKLAMTGTPVENHLGEYYSILDLALPGLLGSYESFKPLIASSKKPGRSEGLLPSLDVVLNRTGPFLLRRTKNEILKELPSKVETDIYLEPTEQQKVLYKKTIEMVRNTIDNAYASKTRSQARIMALTAILRLRQICVSPRLLDPSLNKASPKITFLIERLKVLIDEGHSALVFSQFTTFLDILETDMNGNGIPFLRLDGSTPTRKRKGLVEGFQRGDGPSIFLLSLKASGQGLNLTRASYVFHLDPWWNPAVENQASDRTHRIGQKNRVSVFRLLIRHTRKRK